MDIVSHALWANLIFKESPIAQRSAVIVLSIMPDFVSFSTITVKKFINRTMSFHRPIASAIPAQVIKLYNATHSLIIWVAIFLLLKIMGLSLLTLAFMGWGLHILLDIFTHTAHYFPTPIFWPLSKFHFSGISWSNKWFMAFNYGVLAFMYLVFYF